SVDQRFFKHIKEQRLTIIVKYNGEYFDWPYVEDRASKYVKRDSYLSVGSQGLKNITHAKLDYNPNELDPEIMTK
ncbi:33499_t:CDS:2, partial [Gigaspora margarita]